MPGPSPSSDPVEPAPVDPAPVDSARVDPSAVETRTEPTEPVDLPEAPAGLVCPVCGATARPGDRFCEVDGTALVPPDGPMVCACGVGNGVDGGDGFCSVCGLKLVAAAPDDQHEALSPAFDLGAATHVGRSHATDEDAVAVGRQDVDGSPLHAIVVCDGVSSTSHGEVVSAAAAAAALDALLADATGALATDPEATLRRAIAEAHRAACSVPVEAVEGKDPPGTTIVAAIAHRGRVDVAWVGDSRAYLIGAPLADGSTLTALALTHDHSWVNEVVDSGQMTVEEAGHSPWAHALLRCLGPVENPDPGQPPEPSVGHATAEPGSRLVVCSDGLWNYAPEPADIAALLAGVPPGADARTAAWTLVHHALALGGHDDVTVAVALL